MLQIYLHYVGIQRILKLTVRRENSDKLEALALLYLDELTTIHQTYPHHFGIQRRVKLRAGRENYDKLEALALLFSDTLVTLPPNTALVTQVCICEWDQPREGRIMINTVYVRSSGP